MEKITIIIPIYNCEKTINRCIDSILQQTYKNFELILVNDGSTDGTSRILCSYKDNRIKLINQENKGTGSARNTGIKYATGDFICFVDGDDYVEPNFLCEGYELIKKYNAQIVACTYKRKKSLRKICILDKIYGMKYLISLPEKIPMSVVGKVFKSNVIKDLSFDVNNKFEDIEFATIAFLRSEKMVFLKKKLYCVTKTLDSRSKFYNSDDKLKACLKGLNLVREKCPSLLNDYMTYTLLNGIAIVNMMIIHDNYNVKLLENIKETVSNNIKCVKHSKYGIIKKLQIYVFDKMFPLYKIIYKIIKKNRRLM